ncbi:RagB/SusD family nutrient uptake outer membrane protein [Puteibacter caeruleilacunae]|nr:RagB/SusD family nutrient uptake outer membrane protein [Puteibacter caeruleilacunae]
MKLKYTYYIILALLTMSCEDFLDKKPDDSMTMDMVFKNKNEVRKWLSNTYSYMPDVELDPLHNGEFWSYISDEGDISAGNGGTGASAINLGNINPNSSWNGTNNWNKYYKAIRSIHIFLDNVEPIPDQLTQDEVDGMMLEARFMRAFYYFLLVRQYGPVPLILEEIPADADSETMQRPRTPFDEIIDWFDTELSDLAQLLPNEVEEIWTGQPTKAVALALRGRILLYAASPQFNGNSAYANVKNLDGTTLFNTTYDVSKWQKAADANKALIDHAESTGLYKLHKVYDGAGNLDPLASYQDLFLEHTEEAIFYGKPGSASSHDRSRLPRHAAGYSRVCVTQEMVDSYFMNDGLTIDASPIYSETGKSTAADAYTEANTFNMYVNREPRFYASVTYSGKKWAVTKKIVDFSLKGKDGSSKNPTTSTTGYLVFKRVNPAYKVNGANPGLRAMHIRLGEVYLNYAEALNEAVGPDHADVRKYIGMIRERAGLTVDSYYPAGLSKDEMREHIHHERKVELAFEGLRYFDIKRWLIAEDIMNNDFHGMKMVGIGDDFFNRTTFETRVFKPAYYLFPIPQSEIDRNENLVQNPGW